MKSLTTLLETGLYVSLLRHRIHFAQWQPVRRAASSKRTSQCKINLYPPHKRECLDMSNVKLERGNQCHANMIRCFLNTHFWPREPTIQALWMSLDSPYIQLLTDKYAQTGDRLLAFENIPRTGERKLIGVAIGNKVFPWMADEFEEWAHYTSSRPERNRMYFCAHCIKAPDLFAKFKVDYIYEIEILCTAAEVTGLGVGLYLLQNLINEAFEVQHPLIQVVAVSAYMAKVCEKAGMKSQWSMAYSDYVDDYGQRVFYPRRPHSGVSIYTKKFDPKSALRGEFNPLIR